MREHWIDGWDVEGGFRAAVTSTESGWTNASLAVQFLEEVIDKETRQPGCGYRLLLMDGHSTHLTLPFLEACDRARIIPALIPAHSTHLMQPLDVGCFGPLSHAYSQALETWQSNLPLASSLTKSDFWRLFEAAWKGAFTKKNITSAFTAAGIWPWCLDKVLAKIPQLPKAEEKAEITLSSKLRLIQQQARRDCHQIWRDPRIKDLIGCLERASVAIECAEHDNQQLRATIARQRKKQAASRQLQHPELPNLGKGLFFTPGKIIKAREWEQDKADKAEAAAEAKAALLVERSLKKAEKEAEAVRKRLELAEKRRIGKEKREREAQEKAEKKAEREAISAANKKAKEETKLARAALKKPKRYTIKKTAAIRNDLLAAQQAQDIGESEWMDIEKAPKFGRRGRIIRKPVRWEPKGR